jgi:hypothetical protein
MKVYFYGFWQEFFDEGRTNNKFFIELLEKTFNRKIEIGTIENSEILFESVFSMDTLLYLKKWKYTFFFSGESDRRVWNSIISGSSRINTLKDYTCILKGEKNNANIVNLPLFVYYNYCFKFDELFVKKPNITNIPKKSVCVIVSNGHDSEGRNYFFDRLEKIINVDYAGKYKNNVPLLLHEHCSKEFIDFVSQYKFIVSMENSKNNTYITEKILHGFSADTIPIYWGSDNIGEYFNEDRFINVKNFDEETINIAINKIIEINNDDNKYLEMVNTPIYVNNKIPFTLENVSNNINNLINKL